ncbi:transmembrane protein adipocyte-associated 1 homolog [Glandiceps talaboti]
MTVEVVAVKPLLDISTTLQTNISINVSTQVTSTVAHPMVTKIPVSNDTNNASLPPCLAILYEEINDSGVRAWDVALLIPNAIFLLFLLINIKSALAKLKNSNSPIITTFYLMVFVVASIGVARCVVSMTVNAASTVGSDIDKILWLVLKFFVLATELSVLIFGLAFGHLDSNSSIKRVLACTTLIALAFSVTQGFLELVRPDHKFQANSKDYDVYGHGGMLFWFISSSFFFLVYSCTFILPFTKLKEKIQLPIKKSFYVYVFILAILNLLQTIGAVLVFVDVDAGFCIVDITTYLYFTCFAPLIYLTFLREFFQTPATTIFFSYKAQVDDGEDGENSLRSDGNPTLN